VVAIFSVCLRPLRWYLSRELKEPRECVMWLSGKEFRAGRRASTNTEKEMSLKAQSLSHLTSSCHHVGFIQCLSIPLVWSLKRRGSYLCLSPKVIASVSDHLIISAGSQRRKFNWPPTSHTGVR
jgi:hypothetical protein